jgi:hypothetical protein
MFWSPGPGEPRNSSRPVHPLPPANIMPAQYPRSYTSLARKDKNNMISNMTGFFSTSLNLLVYYLFFPRDGNHNE